MTEPAPEQPERTSERVAWVIVAAIAAIALIPRLTHFGGSYLGDELSTLYIVKGQSLGDVISSVQSDAEISPPLYFVLGWLFSKLGSAPELRAQLGRAARTYALEHLSQSAVLQRFELALAQAVKARTDAVGGGVSAS